MSLHEPSLLKTSSNESVVSNISDNLYTSIHAEKCHLWDAKSTCNFLLWLLQFLSRNAVLLKQPHMHEVAVASNQRRYRLWALALVTVINTCSQDDMSDGYQIFSHQTTGPTTITMMAYFRMNSSASPHNNNMFVKIHAGENRTSLARCLQSGLKHIVV